MQIGFIGGVSGGEMVVVLIVMLLLFGSKKLPGMARSLGRSVEELRRSARQVRDEFMNADLEGDAPVSDPPRNKTPWEAPENAPAAPDDPTRVEIGPVVSETGENADQPPESPPGQPPEDQNDGAGI
jgi:sec-independent protein translocase protein TatA